METTNTTQLTKDAFSLARHNRYSALKHIFSSESEPFDPDTIDPKGNTILLVGCQNGLRRIVRLALKYGADINFANHAGNTALHFCYMYGFADTIGTYLREKGADPELRNLRGEKCTDVRVRSGGVGGTYVDTSFGSSEADTSFNNNTSFGYEPIQNSMINEEVEESSQHSFHDGENNINDGGWASDYVNEYAEGGGEGYESSGVWSSDGGGFEDSADEGFLFQEGNFGDEDFEGGFTEGDEGGRHYVSEEGLSCYEDDAGGRYYWDDESGEWRVLQQEKFDGEEKVQEEEKMEEEKIDEEGKTQEKEEGKAQEEEKVLVQKGNFTEDSKETEQQQPKQHQQQRAQQKTKRRPPPQPSPGKTGKNAFGKFRPVPPSSQGKQKRAPPTSPLPKKGRPAPPSINRPLPPGARGGNHSGGSNVTRKRRRQQNPQLQLMETIASNNLSKIESLLKSKSSLTSSDIHSALMNAVLSGRIPVIRLLIPYARKDSIEYGLIVASKMCNVAVMRVLIEKVGKEGRARALLVASGSGVGGVVEVFFEDGNEEGKEEEHGQEYRGEYQQEEKVDTTANEENFKKPEVMRMILSCAGKNQSDALQSLLPHISSRSGEIVGGRTGVLSSICKQALTIAIAKGHKESAMLLLKYVSVTNLDSCLSQCCAIGNIEILHMLVDEMVGELGREDDFFKAVVRQGVNVARAKRNMDCVEVLQKFDTKGGLKKGHSAAELIKTKSFRIESGK